MYLSIIVLPLIGSIVAGFFGRKVGSSGSQIITCTSVIITTILSIFAFVEVGFNNIPVSISLFKWVGSEWLNILWSFQFDSLTVSMLIPVLIISSLVHIYSIGYMDGDPHNQRFFSYLSLFTFMMIILVTGNSYLLMFVGWEGVGVCSYLLVSFWFTRIAANQSSMSAFLTNRVGDCFLTIGMFAMFWSLGNLDYSTIFSLGPYMNENVITIIGICLLIGAMAKSSQIGLHVWLPMAMEGPTPVSALIHAATMVTAGVYLLIRSSPLIEYSSTTLSLCLWLGAITTVMSSLTGLFQQDIKKVIAYSTMSQLGMMVIAVGLSSYNIALFHLINHAFYKGLLFLGAGAVIHAVADNQDFRKYGGLISFLPLTYSVMLIASLSLVAFPFMTGFYSKDLILESAFGQFTFSGISVYVISTIGAVFTTLYSVKVLYLTFLAKPSGPRKYFNGAHEGNIFMTLPLIILAIFSIFFGFIVKDIFIGLGSSFFADNGLFIHPNHEILINTEFAVSTLFKLLPFIFTIFFTGLGIIFFEFLPEFVTNFKFSRLGYYNFGFFNQRFLFELFYNKYVANLVLNLGGQTTKILDKGSIELIGPYGLEKSLIIISKNITKLNNGIVTNYALFIVMGFISYLLIYSNFNVFFLVLLGILFIFSLIIYNNYFFTQITLESNIFDWKLITKHLTFVNISLGMVSVISFFILRTYVFKEIPLLVTIFQDIQYSFVLPVNLSSSVGTLFIRLSLKGFLEELQDKLNGLKIIFKKLVLELESNFKELGWKFKSIFERLNFIFKSIFEKLVLTLKTFFLKLERWILPTIHCASFDHNNEGSGSSSNSANSSENNLSTNIPPTPAPPYNHPPHVIPYTPTRNTRRSNWPAFSSRVNNTQTSSEIYKTYISSEILGISYVTGITYTRPSTIINGEVLSITLKYNGGRDWTYSQLRKFLPDEDLPEIQYEDILAEYDSFLKDIHIDLNCRWRSYKADVDSHQEWYNAYKKTCLVADKLPARIGIVFSQVMDERARFHEQKLRKQSAILGHINADVFRCYNFRKNITNNVYYNNNNYTISESDASD